MVPTIQPGGVIIAEREPNDLKRGDIVVFTVSDLSSNTEFAKRIVGLPGESVYGTKERIFINGKPLDEPYIKSKEYGTFGPITVPDESFFVLGDFPSNSIDSRQFGVIPMKNIVGRNMIIIYPLNHIKVLF